VIRDAIVFSLLLLL